MKLFADIKRKPYAEVADLLSAHGYESVLKHIELTDGRYRLNAPIQEITPLPTYKFALACTLAALGNLEQAEEVVSEPERFTEPDWGDSISRNLALAFCK